MTQTPERVKADGPLTYQQFEQLFIALQKNKRVERREAVGIMSGDAMKKAIEKNRALVLNYGRRGEKVSYSPEDLKRMVLARDKLERLYAVSGPAAGVAAAQLMAHSRPEDRQRAAMVKSAVIYAVKNGNVLHARVPSVSRAGEFYQVRVRLEEWAVLSRRIGERPGGSYLEATQQALRGRLSFDCTCGRHQYWYRYLATIGGFALDPKESGFPKIRNPKLTGCCCKHVLKTLQTLQGPAVARHLAMLMENQAAATRGFATGGPAKMLDKLLGKKAAGALAKSGQANRMAGDEAIKAAYKEYLGAAKALPGIKEAAAKLPPEKKPKPRNKKPKVLVDGLTEARRAALAHDLSIWMMAMVVEAKHPRDKAMKIFADNNGLKPEQVANLAKDYNV